MEFDLTPKNARKIFEGEGGEYYSWTSSDLTLLSEAKVGAGKLVLHHRGFALPHYADSAKVGFVIQGCHGLVGMVLPNSPNEVVLELRKGDLIPVPLGAVSWWFNAGESPLEIVFLGDTTTAHQPGNFTYFFLSGVLSLFGGFSTDFIRRFFDTDADETAKLLKSQTGVLIIKLDETKTLPNPNPSDKEMVYNIGFDFSPESGGVRTKVTKSEFPFIGEVGFSANHVKLEAHSAASPVYTANSAVQVVYVTNGSGRIQVVGFNGSLALDSEVRAGHLLVIPKFFAVAQIAGGDGLECFSIINSSEPVLQDLAGKASAMAALSPEVLRASFNLSADFEQHLLGKIRSSSTILPSKEK